MIDALNFPVVLWPPARRRGARPLDVNQVFAWPT
jgi:hypothetical protein